ncbi:MAG: hypothetical protein R3B41_02810 [Candidatus Doudnabacteria bacterium]
MTKKKRFGLGRDPSTSLRMTKKKRFGLGRDPSTSLRMTILLTLLLRMTQRNKNQSSIS